ncbi:MAG TPA: ABC transporter substrate-binding protein [Luteimicrobium sp.]|nr:ABC transporter substrate-binding protein [Luteimicrobium sp.]
MSDSTRGLPGPDADSTPEPPDEGSAQDPAATPAPAGPPVDGGALPADGEASAADASYLPSGARLDEAAGPDADASLGLSRRTLLRGTLAGAAVIAAGGLGSWWFVRSQEGHDKATGLAVTKSWADRQLTVTSPSGACDAPLIVAYEKGLFRKAGLDVVLKKTANDENVPAAVGSGKYVASNGIFFNFLGPIYNGTPVRLSGGLHHGCLDLYVRNDGSVPTVASLKGKKIGTGNLQGSATNFFSLDLLDAGINSSPEAKEVEWVVIEQDLLPKALKDGKVDAIATAGGYLPIIQGVQEGWAVELSDNKSKSRNASYPCCAVVLNDDFVSQDPVTAAKLVNVWAQGSRWAGANLEETAEIESSGNYVAGTPAEILPVLKTLTFDPSPKNLQQVLEPGIAKFVKTGFLPAGTDPKALAQKVFVDLGLNF